MPEPTPRPSPGHNNHLKKWTYLHYYLTTIEIKQQDFLRYFPGLFHETPVPMILAVGSLNQATYAAVALWYTCLLWKKAQTIPIIYTKPFFEFIMDSDQKSI